MTQPRRILQFSVFAATVLLLPWRVAGQSGTIPQITTKSVARHDTAIAALARGRSAEVPTTTKQSVLESYGKLPLSFEANQGQTDSRVKFLSRGSGYALFLTSREAVLALKAGPLARPAASQKADLARLQEVSADTASVRSSVLRMSLVGANPAPAISPEDELPGRSYYFIGNDPKKWHSDVPNYAKVQYEDVYPGVNLVYYGNQGQLEHDFVVAPGADPKAILIRFQGARKLRIDDRGDLVVDVGDGQVRLLKPEIYQEASGVRREIAGGYVLKGARLVSFQVAAYDADKPLVIDPVLRYSTYLGGTGGDEGFGIAVDSSGNAYVTGLTESSNFPTVNPLPAPNDALQGIVTAFVSKLSFSGSTLRLVYSTYLGGSLIDEGTAIAVDSSGNAYVTGFTKSTNFPTVNPLPAPNNALQSVGGNAFVSKLSFSGSSLSLAYSTYLGGSFADEGTGIAVDSSGNAYVTGFTQSANFPTVNPLPPPGNAPPGLFGVTAFVSKLSFSGSTLSLAYSTYLGGSRPDEGNAIAVDSSGNAYVTGLTESTDFPTVNPLAAPNNALQGFVNAFVSKLSFSGSTLSLAYSTYLGGSHIDEGLGIAVDSTGNAYVTGFTQSANFPMVNPLPAPNNALQGFQNAFVSKLSFSGSTLSLVYSTYLGGSGSDQGFGIAVDSSGNAYVAGSTQSTNFPTVNPLPAPNNALQSTAGNAFVSQLSFSGSTLSLPYSTYLGGSSFDQGRGIAVDPSGNAYVTGFTGSANFPTVNPLPAPNNVLQGGVNAFVARITSRSSTSTTVASSANPSVFGQSVTFTATVSPESGSGTPTGTVSFNDGAATLSTGTLSSGQASFTTSSLSVGSHNITAAYGGDSNFTGSTSAALTQNVEYSICVLYDQSKAVHGGATFPIKVALCDANGVDVSSSTIVLNAKAVTMASGFSGTPDSPGNANPDNDFRFDGTLGTTGGYIFNLSTGVLAPGTYSLQFAAGADPALHAVMFGVAP